MRALTGDVSCVVTKADARRRRAHCPEGARLPRREHGDLSSRPSKSKLGIKTAARGSAASKQKGALPALRQQAGIAFKSRPRRAFRMEITSAGSAPP